MPKIKENTIMTWGDLFAGGGGATTGAYGVEGVQVLWALNHSPTAIATHKANHPETVHYQSDILVQDEHVLPQVDGIWMSSECTNHSNAKGGKLLDQGSRTLPMELIRFAKHCKPKIIIVENVWEFTNWGPLLENCRPDKSRKGDTFKEWVEAIKECGYTNYEHRKLNSADYGAHTSRSRYFGIFTKPGIEITWPEPTHSKNGDNGLPQWKACKEKLNLSDFGESIWNKNLCENTIKRIRAGLEKYGGDPSSLDYYNCNKNIHNHSGNNGIDTAAPKHKDKIQFIMKYGYDPKHSPESLEEPISTIMTMGSHLVVTQFVASNYSSGDNPGANVQSIDAPMHTITVKDRHAVVSQFRIVYHGNKHDDDKERVNNLENPMDTIDTSNRHAVVTQISPVLESEILQFLNSCYSTDKPATMAHSVDAPIGTITASNSIAVVTQTPPNVGPELIQFLEKHYNSDGHPESQIQSIEQPIATISTNNKIGVVTQFIAKQQNSNGHPEYNTQTIEVPLSSLTTRAKHSLISELFGDIFFRFISIQEAKELQGFPPDYILIGNKGDQLKHIGNAVVPIMAKVLIESNLIEEVA